MLITYASSSEMSVVLKNNPRVLDPTHADASSMPIMASIYESLLKIDESGQVVPNIAESWKVQGRNVTFQLGNRFWSNGDKIRSQDFIFAFKRLMDPSTGGRFAHLYFGIENAQQYSEGEVSIENVGIKAIDDKQLVITFKNSTDDPIKVWGSAFAFVAFTPLNEKYLEEYPYKYGSIQVLSNGPYLMKGWGQDSIILEKNPNYKQKVNIDKIEFFFVRDEYSAVSLFANNQVDMLLSLSVVGLRELNDGDEIKPYLRDAKTFYLEVNTRLPKFTSVVRKIIAEAIDRETLCNKVLSSMSCPSYGIVPKGYPGKIKSFREENGDNLFSETSDKSIHNLKSFRLLATNTASSTRVAQYIQERMEKVLGINVIVETVPLTIKMDRVTKGDYEVALSGWMVDHTAPPFDFLSMLASNSIDNHTGWSNDTFDRLIELAQQEDSTDTIYDLLGKAEKEVFSEGGFPIIPLYYGRSNYAIKPKIKGVRVYSGAGSPDFRQAYIDE